MAKMKQNLFLVSLIYVSGKLQCEKEATTAKRANAEGRW